MAMWNNQRAIPCFLVRIETCFDVFCGLFVVRPFQRQRPKKFSDQSLWPSIRRPFLSCGNWIRSSNWHRICSGTRIFSAHRSLRSPLTRFTNFSSDRKVFHSFSGCWFDDIYFIFPGSPQFYPFLLVVSRWNCCQAAPLAWKKSAMRLLPPHRGSQTSRPWPGWMTTFI